MSMCGINDNDVHMCVDQGIHTVHHISRDADACTAEQPALNIFCGERVFDLFFDIFDGDKTF